MLTLILLAVLGGGVGLLAVWLAEDKPARSRPGSRRGREAGDAAVTSTVTEVAPVPERSPTPVVEPELAPVHVPSGPPRVESTKGVPKGLTAVEGPYAVVARASAPRRLGSLAGLGVVLVLVAVLIAVVLGAVVAGGSELIGNAIG